MLEVIKKKFKRNKIDTLTRDILLKNIDNIIIFQNGKINIEFRWRSEHRWIKKKMKIVITKSTLTGGSEFKKTLTQSIEKSTFLKKRLLHFEKKFNIKCSYWNNI